MNNELFKDNTILLLTGLHDKTQASAIPKIIEWVESGHWLPETALTYIQDTLPEKAQKMIDAILKEAVVSGVIDENYLK